MKILIALCLALICASASAARNKSYAGYKLVQTRLLREFDLTKLSQVMMREEFNMWSHPRLGSPVDILVAPEHHGQLREILQRLDLKPTTRIKNVGQIEKLEMEQIEKVRAKENGTLDSVTFKRYMTFEETQMYLLYLAATYPDLASLIEIGRSTQDRPLRVLKISNGPGKKAIFADAGIHAREWLTIPVALKIAFELLENYSTNKALVDMVDWYILPVANPDGYIYSWRTDRYWRKNRSPNPGTNCVGVNSNSNFDFHWGEQEVTFPCADNWPGFQPFTEPEAVAMAKFITTNEISMYLAIHSYAQVLVFPYGHTRDLPPTDDELYDTAKEAVAALETVYGTKYRVGTMGNVLYLAYGTCRDWAYEVAGVPMTFTLELPGFGFGFSPPIDKIDPVVTETWEMIKVLAFKASKAEKLHHAANNLTKFLYL